MNSAAGTSTADERCQWCDSRATGTAEFPGGGRLASCGAHGFEYRETGLEPPRFEDLAPGTRFTVTHRTLGLQTVMITDEAEMMSAEGGRSMWIQDIDPSTIRDVTPPPDRVSVQVQTDAEMSEKMYQQMMRDTPIREWRGGIEFTAIVGLRDVQFKTVGKSDQLLWDSGDSGWQLHPLSAVYIDRSTIRDIRRTELPR